MPALTTSPGYKDFTDAAWKAATTGGTLGLDKNQQPRTSHTTVWGRALRWIRNRVFPNKAQNENMRVLTGFEQAARKRYGATLPQDKIHSLLHGQLAGMPLAEKVVNAAHIFKRLAQQGYAPQATLQGEVAEAKRLGYVQDIVDTEGARAIPDKGFHYVVGQYNRTMSDLYQRFPLLSGAPPPKLSREPPGQKNTEPGAREPIGRYNARTRKIQFTNESPEGWEGIHVKGKATGFLTPAAPGIQGAITHEYGHHLSLSVIKPPKWYPRLPQTLKDNGVMDKKAFPDINNKDGGITFNEAVKENGRKTGLGEYGLANAREFAAEALASYMAPGYGTESVPRLPAFMERWLQDSFPFLRKVEL